MALSKKPVNGMKDILPAEMEIRDYVTSVIKDTYRSFGFTPIETPCMENIANLSNKQGGENEKLIFKVLKRGEKLNLETAKEEADVVDFGMRYDLTVPLSRFYANHANDLPTPFKALQIGSVWRADRPQRGRYRQFTQCDIDILGEPSNLAEIELITATTTTIGRLGFKNFEIRINERRILKAMAAYSGFEEKDYDTYVPGSSERMLLYRELDRIENDDDLAAYRKRIIDRFGPVPREGEELMHVVSLRRLGKRLGCEKIMLKQGTMQMQFVSNVQSPFYRSTMFSKVLNYATSHVQQCALKEKNNKRFLRIARITSVEQAVAILQEIQK